MTINERIKFLRTSKGLDIQQVEKTTGIDVNSLYKYEQSVTPRPGKLKILADFYGVTVEYLINGENSQNLTNNQTSVVTKEMFAEIREQLRLKDQQILFLQSLISKTMELGKMLANQDSTTPVFDINEYKKTA